MCLAEGSVCNGQDFSCPQPSVKPVMANSLKAIMRVKLAQVTFTLIEGWREASQGFQACSHTTLLLGLKRKPNKPVGLTGENLSWLFFVQCMKAKHQGL